jgi:hypothetical protein
VPALGVTLALAFGVCVMLALALELAFCCCFGCRLLLVCLLVLVVVGWLSRQATNPTMRALSPARYSFPAA